MSPDLTGKSAAPADASVRKSPRLWIIVLAVVLAASVAGAHFHQRVAVRQAARVEFHISSPAPFAEDKPRVGQLIVVHPDGTRTSQLSKRYGSAFLDQRNTFFFEVADGHARQFQFAPAPPGNLVAVSAVMCTAAGTKQPQAVPLDQLIALQQVEILKRTPDQLILKTLAGEGLPLLGLNLPPVVEANPSGNGAIIVESILLFVGSFSIFALVLRAIARGRGNAPIWSGFFWRLALPFLVVITFVTTMALLSKFNSHPDEYLHFETANYFVSHWLPPALDDPATAPSISHYGVTYLQDFDAAYLAMGKFMALIPKLLTSREIGARIFNVLLFAVLAAGIARRLSSSLAPAILLISPQIWYVFSYVNGDAWALAVSLVIVIQLADDDSLLSRYLEAPGYAAKLSGGLGFAGLTALMLLAKHNYYLFLPFVALVAFWKTAIWRGRPSGQQLAKKWALILLAALAFYLPIRIGQEAINRFEKSRLQTEQAEKFGAPQFRPSAIASGEGSPRLNLRAKGVRFSDLLSRMKWAQTSFQSFCGVYGWMRINAGGAYYTAMGALYLVLFLAALAAIRRLPSQELLFAAATVALAFVVVLLSAYHSWTRDFQPQGRYLFPILPMAAFLLHRYRESLRSRAFYLLFACLFACSIYSFIWIGLLEIPK